MSRLLAIAFRLWGSFHPFLKLGHRHRPGDARADSHTIKFSQDLGAGHSTVGRILCRAGLNRLANLEPAKPVQQHYEYPIPGGLLHLDIKKHGRFRRRGPRATGDRRQDSPGAGWE